MIIKRFHALKIVTAILITIAVLFACFHSMSGESIAHVTKITEKKLVKSTNKNPLKVKGVKVVKKGEKFVKIKWRKAKRANKYQVFMKKGKKLKIVKTTKARNVTIKRLKPNKIYSFRVRGVNDKSAGSYSKVLKVKTKKKRKKSKEGKKLERVIVTEAKAGKEYDESHRYVTIKWKKVANASYYEIHKISQRTKKIDKYCDQSEGTSFRFTEWMFTVKDTTYLYCIRAVRLIKDKDGIIKKTIYGTYSKAVSVLVKRKKPSSHNSVIPINKIKPKDIMDGDTYYYSNGAETMRINNVLADVEGDRSGYAKITGETEEGGSFYYYIDKEYYIPSEYMYIINNDLKKQYFDHTHKEAIGKQREIWTIEVKDDETKVYWTSDGTMPKVGQNEKLGCDLYDSSGGKKEKLHKYEDQGEDSFDWRIRGTESKGRSVIDVKVLAANYPAHNPFWLKVYKKDKLLYEYRRWNTGKGR